MSSSIRLVIILLSMCWMGSFICLPIDELREHLDSPAVKAFLDTIAYAEGTLHKEGYRHMFGDLCCKALKRHPCRIICAPCGDRELCSSAAGKYQFLQKTWEHVARKTGIDSFSPLHQDCGAVYLLKKSGALELIKKEEFSGALEKSNKIWASLPGAHYKQPTKSKLELHKIFLKQLAYYKKLLTKENQDELKN